MKHLGNEQFRLTKMEAQLWVMGGVQAREKSDHEKLSFKCHLKVSFIPRQESALVVGMIHHWLNNHTQKGLIGGAMVNLEGCR